MTEAGAPSAKRTRAARPRRQRSLTESLLSIVLALEAVVVFFITLTVYGLHALPPLQAFVGGAVLVVVLLLVSRLVRYPFGVWLGWVMQVVLVATGVVLAALYIVAAFFVAMWIFCFVRARQIDAANAASAGAPAAQSTVPTEGETQE